MRTWGTIVPNTVNSSYYSSSDRLIDETSVVANTVDDVDRANSSREYMSMMESVTGLTTVRESFYSQSHSQSARTGSARSGSTVATYTMRWSLSFNEEGRTEASSSGSTINLTSKFPVGGDISTTYLVTTYGTSGQNTYSSASTVTSAVVTTVTTTRGRPGGDVSTYTTATGTTKVSFNTELLRTTTVTATVPGPTLSRSFASEATHTTTNTTVTLTRTPQASLQAIAVEAESTEDLWIVTHGGVTSASSRSMGDFWGNIGPLSSLAETATAATILPLVYTYKPATVTYEALDPPYTEGSTDHTYTEARTIATAGASTLTTLTVHPQPQVGIPLTSTTSIAGTVSVTSTQTLQRVVGIPSRVWTATGYDTTTTAHATGTTTVSSTKTAPYNDYGGQTTLTYPENKTTTLVTTTTRVTGGGVQPTDTVAFMPTRTATSTYEFIGLSTIHGGSTSQWNSTVDMLRTFRLNRYLAVVRATGTVDTPRYRSTAVAPPLSEIKQSEMHVNLSVPEPLPIRYSSVYDGRYVPVPPINRTTVSGGVTYTYDFSEDTVHYTKRDSSSTTTTSALIQGVGAATETFLQRGTFGATGITQPTTTLPQWTADVMGGTPKLTDTGVAITKGIGLYVGATYGGGTSTHGTTVLTSTETQVVPNTQVVANQRYVIGFGVSDSPGGVASTSRWIHIGDRTDSPASEVHGFLFVTMNKYSSVPEDRV